MGTTDAIADLDGLVMQAWKEEGIEATRQKVEARLIEERQRRLARYRQEGRALEWSVTAATLAQFRARQGK